MVRLIVAAVLTFALSAHAAGAANVGNGQGKQSNAGACVSDADCASACCAGLNAGAVCSARNAAFNQGKRGCGFRAARAGGTGGTGSVGGQNGQNGGNGRTGGNSGVGGIGGGAGQTGGGGQSRTGGGQSRTGDGQSQTGDGQGDAQTGGGQGLFPGDQNDGSFPGDQNDGSFQGGQNDGLFQGGQDDGLFQGGQDDGGQGGVGALEIFQNNDPNRPFAVLGNSFTTQGEAVQRGACQNAVQSGAVPGVDISACDAQIGQCISDLS
ncbi:hypothetical protein ACQRIT_002883 [Beauveria bassiana]